MKDLQSTSSALTGHCQLDAARILTFDENQERKWCISENVFSHIIFLHVFFLVQFLKKKRQPSNQLSELVHDRYALAIIKKELSGKFNFCAKITLSNCNSASFLTQLEIHVN